MVLGRTSCLVRAWKAGRLAGCSLDALKRAPTFGNTPYSEEEAGGAGNAASFLAR